MLGLVIGTVAWATLPQHRAATIAAGAAWTLVKEVRKRLHSRKAKNEDGSVVDEVSSGVELEWQDVRLTLLDKKGRVKKQILKGISGKATPGRLLAIMGPSGETTRCCSQQFLLAKCPSIVLKLQNMSIGIRMQ
jgi:hypothetical protein